MPLLKPSRIRTATLLTVFISSPAGLAAAEPVNILALGDSITWGLGDTNKTEYSLGYRAPLQQMLYDNGGEYDFIGGFQVRKGWGDYTGSYETGHYKLTHPEAVVRSDGTPFDLDHFGWSGAEAAGGDLDDRDLANALRGISTNRQVDLNRNGIQDVDVFGGQQAEVILLHVGANDIESDIASAQKAADNLAELFRALDESLADGKIQAGGKILLADMIPVTGSGGGTDVNPDVYASSVAYNAMIDQALADAGLSDELLGMIVRIEMDHIAITDELLAFTGLSESMLDQDGDGFADWVYDSDCNGDIDAVNTALYDDGLHPSTEGYALMAYQWYKGMESIGAVHAPSPAAMGMGLVGLGGLVLRRRR